jgi:hypothetical protein
MPKPNTPIIEGSDIIVASLTSPETASVQACISINKYGGRDEIKEMESIPEFMSRFSFTRLRAREWENGDGVKGVKFMADWNKSGIELEHVFDCYDVETPSHIFNTRICLFDVPRDIEICSDYAPQDAYSDVQQPSSERITLNGLTRHDFDRVITIPHAIGQTTILLAYTA